ncbi:hypothetical protein ACHAXR_013241 [Thalassiosira sp. AJA248-18]
MKMNEMNNENEMGDYIIDQEVMEQPLREQNRDDEAETKNVLQEKGCDGDASEDNNPRRGRPGIVVFSGGTAFNNISAEMASRNFGRSGGVSGEEAISRSNSISSLMDLMAMGSMEAANPNSNQGTDNIAGGTKVWHVLPVTDDGGSTAEIVRVLGGPAVGDIRSRLLRLAPGTTQEARAVRRLLGHRLVSMQSLDKKDGNGQNEVTHEMISRMAREEWLDILDGGHESYQQSDFYDDGNTSESNKQPSCEHPLWNSVSAPYRSIIRAFLVHFHNQVLQTHNGIRQSQSHPPFDFTGGSVGNYFFAGARIFFGSLPAAIFLFSKVAGIPSGSRVIPAVLSEERLVLGAVLKNGTRIRGQYMISHPHPKQPPQPQPKTKPLGKDQIDRSGGGSSRHRQVVKSSLDSEDAISSLHPSPISKMAYLLNDPTWRRRNAQHRQSTNTSSAAQQLWSDQHEISPEPNPLVLDAISNAACIVYGCGSLFSSVLPSLVLEGVGQAISCRDVPKVLLLNGWHDSETSWAEPSRSDNGERIVKRMDATSFVEAVVDALDQERLSTRLDSQDDNSDSDSGPIPLVTDYITHILFPVGTEIDIDETSLNKYCMRRQGNPAIHVRGIDSIPADTCVEGSRSGGQSHHRVFDPHALVDALLDLAGEK